jgi:hypothetical protein
VNRFLTEFAPFAEPWSDRSREHDTRPLLGRMAVVNAYKTLQANLRHVMENPTNRRGI